MVYATPIENLAPLKNLIQSCWKKLSQEKRLESRIIIPCHIHGNQAGLAFEVVTTDIKFYYCNETVLAKHTTKTGVLETRS
uniref:Uncharacterized protein n=1 Tax=Romanomermis culicivorax TaxID=13658 RepID=A0A915J2Y9_ROMCU